MRKERALVTIPIRHLNSRGEESFIPKPLGPIDSGQEGTVLVQPAKAPQTNDKPKSQLFLTETGRLRVTQPKTPAVPERSVMRDCDTGAGCWKLSQRKERSRQNKEQERRVERSTDSSSSRDYLGT